MFLGTCETNSNWQGWSDLPGGAFDSEEERAKAQSLYDALVALGHVGTLKAKNVDDSLMKLALERIKKHPVECLKRWFIKIPRLWYQFYIPIYFYREASGGFFIFYFLFAVIAFWKGTNRERELMAPFSLAFVYITFIFLPLHIEPRFGVALIPGIICLASIGIWKVLSGRHAAFRNAGY
jgi:hypothetical protein